MSSELLELTETDVEESLLEVSNVGDSMNMYLLRIGKRPLLGATEERDLARSSKLGDDRAKHKLIEHNLKLVVSVAKIYSRSGLPLPDLIQEGNIGLIKAVDSFDPEKGFRFSTHAFAWIRQAIARAIERQGRAIRVPSYAIQGNRKLHKTSGEFINTFGREPTIEELSEMTGWPKEKVVRLLESSEALVSLDDIANDVSDTSLLELLTQTGVVDPEEDALRRESLKVLGQLMSWLSPQERLIIKKRFGLANGATSTLQEIGQQLHITRERVRQLEARALKKLRMAVTQSWLETYFET